MFSLVTLINFEQTQLTQEQQRSGYDRRPCKHFFGGCVCRLPCLVSIDTANKKKVLIYGNSTELTFTLLEIEAMDLTFTALYVEKIQGALSMQAVFLFFFLCKPDVYNSGCSKRDAVYEKI